jgi:uncharacterized protein YbaR (Trm112 family)
MNWNNLKILTCPRCEEDLELNPENKNMFFCNKCEKFTITVDKLKRVVGSMYVTKRDFYGQAEFEELLNTELNGGDK